MMVSEADRIKAVERVRRSMGPNLGDSPSTFKRKRGIYRALKRKDPNIAELYNHELVISFLLSSLEMDMYGRQ